MLNWIVWNRTIHMHKNQKQIHFSREYRNIHKVFFFFLKMLLVVLPVFMINLSSAFIQNIKSGFLSLPLSFYLNYINADRHSNKSIFFIKTYIERIRLVLEVLDASLLNTQHYKVRIKGKVKPSREGVAPSPTSWCSSYRKGSLRVTLDDGRQLHFICIKIDLALITYNGWCAIKPNQMKTF